MGLRERLGLIERSELREKLRNSESPEDKWLILGDILKSLIRDKAKIVNRNMLYVGKFLNFCVDNENLGPFGEIVANAYAQKYGQDYITKVLTVESSGNAFAQLVANGFDKRKQMISAKKEIPATLTDEELYSSESKSYTKGEKKGEKEYIFIEKSSIERKDKIVVIDDFSAEGKAKLALLDIIINQAGAELAGIAVLITKNFKGQEGYKILGEYIKKYNIDYKKHASLNTVVMIEDMSTTIEKIKYRKSSPLILN